MKSFYIKSSFGFKGCTFLNDFVTKYISKIISKFPFHEKFSNQWKK